MTTNCLVDSCTDSSTCLLELSGADAGPPLLPAYVGLSTQSPYWAPLTRHYVTPFYLLTLIDVDIVEQ